VTTEPSSWLPAGFVKPERLDLLDGRYHLRPIHPDDTEKDMVAVMGSRERLWEMYGASWGWPPADMTADDDRRDLARHADEMARNESFNYALFDREETVLLGCVYIDPPVATGADADISWWVVDDLVGGEVDAALDRAIPSWVDRAWPLERPRYFGRPITSIDRSHDSDL
jgi:hypothetical protein